MPIFQKTASEQAKINAFLSTADETLSGLSAYADYIPLSELRRVRDAFAEKVEDIYEDALEEDQ